MGERKNLVFGIKAPDGTEVMPKRQWLWSRERVQEALAKGELAFLKDRDGNWSVHTKQYLKDEDGAMRQSKSFSIIDDVYSQHGTNEILSLFGDAQVFPFPKPTGLLKPLLQLFAPEDGDLVCDLFGGSGSTAHAILQANAEESKTRKYILVQLPEQTGRSDFRTIADITKERVRRVAATLAEKKSDQLSLTGSRTVDTGFRAFRLDVSNFKPWDGAQSDAPDGVAKQLELHVDHVLSGRSQEDILTELLLKSGFPLSTKVEAIQLAGKQVFSVEDGAMLVCLDDKLTPEVIKAMADMKPSRVICLDVGFQGNDQLKTNAVQTMKARGVLSFRTV